MRRFVRIIIWAIVMFLFVPFAYGLTPNHQNYFVLVLTVAAILTTLGAGSMLAPAIAGLAHSVWIYAVLRRLGDYRIGYAVNFFMSVLIGALMGETVILGVKGLTTVWKRWRQGPERPPPSPPPPRPPSADLAESYIRLGVTYEEMGKRDEALNAYQQAVRLDQADAEAHYRLGLLFLQLKDHRAASDEHEILNQLNPQLAQQLAEFIGITI